MPSKRDLRLDKYGISKHRYRELYNFCLRYEEMKAERTSCYSLDGSPLSGMPRGTVTSDTTAVKAERALRLTRDIELIEQTAQEAAGDLYPWLLKAVTRGSGWETINPPCGERQYHRIRRKFFFLLSLKK